jgi:hypothetical protein
MKSRRFAAKFMKNPIEAQRFRCQVLRPKTCESSIQDSGAGKGPVVRRRISTWLFATDPLFSLFAV